MKAIVSNNKIKELLPQKDPFRMVSCLLSYQEDSILSGFNVEENTLFHNNGQLAPSGMIENIAQTQALHSGYSYFLRNEKPPVGYIASIKKVEFFQSPKVEDFITTKVKIIREFMGITLITGTIKRENEVLMTAQLKTFIAE